MAYHLLLLTPFVSIYLMVTHQRLMVVPWPLTEVLLQTIQMRVIYHTKAPLGRPRLHHPVRWWPQMLLLLASWLPRTPVARMSQLDRRDLVPDLCSLGHAMLLAF